MCKRFSHISLAAVTCLLFGLASRSAFAQPAQPPQAADEKTSLKLGEAEVPADAEAEKDDGFWIWPETVAKSGNLCTDRPGFSDAVCVMPRGQIQLESGYSFYYEKESGTRTENHLLGEFSLRTGLMENFELRIKWAGYSITESRFEGTSRWAGRRIMQTDHEDGATDMSIGFKSQLLKQDK